MRGPTFFLDIIFNDMSVTELHHSGEIVNVSVCKDRLQPTHNVSTTTRLTTNQLLLYLYLYSLFMRLGFVLLLKFLVQQEKKKIN